MSPSLFRPIATTLIRTVFLWATLCALAIGSIQAAYSYIHVQDRFELAVREIGQTNVPLLSVSIWDIEPEAIRRQLEVIAARPEIGYVSLTVTTGQVFSAGDKGLAKNQPRRFDIPPPARPVGVIGNLEIFENPAAFYRELIYTLGVASLGYGVLTLLICILIAYLLKRDLERPLRQVAQFASELTPNRLTIPLELARSPGHGRDEIDLVVEGFSVLQSGINSHIANLDEQVAQRTAELEAALASIHRLSTIDPLTGCFNRRLFNERIQQELDRAVRYQRSLAVIFCDIDHFKQINDTCGHLLGDQVLQETAECFRRELRGHIDWVARYGGEEFVIVLPETSLPAAVATAERLRLALSPSMVMLVPTLTVTASFGVTQHVPGETVQELLQRADKLLYAAKAAGRNQTLPKL
ncbi:sensor domain-containing diguanylate cyclase [Ferribacterium limneticum]|uniref:sensor domain-containing diguanylate cyclase n=1 Tax=Ferribacterium limneticum TaxID=76259 RepID=UPI001CFA4B4F|nr:GGDEF domain-containing protein [Ferribacterium limneticum]UCV29791.1 diguanylate cyclase [Ferribacterium limneticum]UCV33710.1 diguanylate cyclase [Ferribacterium limneticum]